MAAAGRHRRSDQLGPPSGTSSEARNAGIEPGPSPLVWLLPDLPTRAFAPYCWVRYPRRHPEKAFTIGGSGRVKPLEVAGVILAAGASRRMGPGRNKLLLRLEGESLVHRAARRASDAGLAPLVVVLGHEADRVRAELADLPCDFALNLDFMGPTSGSLHKGLERSEEDTSELQSRVARVCRTSRVKNNK